MRTSKVVHVVSCHAEGEVGDVIVGGVAPPPGASVWEQARWIAEDNGLRNFVLNEPRGGVFRHVNLLVPPKDPRAQMGWIIMEPADTPPMSGSNWRWCTEAGADSTVPNPHGSAADGNGLGFADHAVECLNGKGDFAVLTWPAASAQLGPDQVFVTAHCCFRVVAYPVPVARCQPMRPRSAMRWT